MAIVNHVPGMEEGDGTRNILVAALYVVFLPWVLVLAPFWLLYALGTNRNGLADAVAASRLGSVPGVGSGGWTAGVTVFVAVLVGLAAIVAAMPIGGSPDTGVSPIFDDPPSTDTPTSTPTVDDGGNVTTETASVETLYSDTRVAHGLTTAVSENGSTIAYGIGSDVYLYDEGGNSEKLPLDVNQSLTHLWVSDRNDRIVAGSRDANSFTAMDSNGSAVWSFSVPGLWNIDTTENMSATSAVTYPDDGPGGVQVAADGAVQWSVDFEDAAGESTAITDDRERVVVGTGRYANGSERRGTPGVNVYDANGTLNWSHGTETNVLSVDVNADENIVVAGTDDGRLLAFDLQGNLLWEDEDDGGYVKLSEDGSTVVSAQSTNVVAFDLEGNEQWRTDLGDDAASEDVFVSSDGERVLATGWMSGGATLIEDGEIVWSETYEGGPIMGDLSDDGRTWSVIVQNTDAGSSDVYAYRLDDESTSRENQSSDSAAAGSASPTDTSVSR